jgi:Xaa-Pro aminopeptidase
MEERKNKLRKILNDNNLDVILLFSSRHDSSLSVWAANIICTSSFHYYYVTKETSGFIEVSFRANDLRSKTKELVQEFEDENKITDFLASFLKKFKRVGLAGNAPFHHFNDIKVTNLTNLISLFLTKKNKYELNKIQALAKKISFTINKLSTYIAPDITELEISAEIKKQVFSFADSFAFPITVISGNRLLLDTVGEPTNRKLLKNDVILIDVGAYSSGFYTDLTKMLFVGDHPLEVAYAKLVRAHHKAISQLNLNSTLSSINELYIKSIKDEGLSYETLQSKYLGHSIGFMLHEEPNILQEQTKNYKIHENMVLALEPEIIVDGYHIRVEDMVQIHNGKAKIITS